jgi:hypothetical protein
LAVDWQEGYRLEKISKQSLDLLYGQHREWIDSEGLRGSRMVLPVDSDVSGSDMSGWQLSGAVFPGVEMAGVDLSGADLGRAVLGGVNLAGADLSGALLQKAEIERSNLENATLALANLHRSLFQSSDLRGANFDQALLRVTELFDVDLDGTWLGGAVLDRPFFSGCRFRGAQVRGAEGRVRADRNFVEGVDGVDIEVSYNQLEVWWRRHGADNVTVELPPGLVDVEGRYVWRSGWEPEPVDEPSDVNRSKNT